MSYAGQSDKVETRRSSRIVLVLLLLGLGAAPVAGQDPAPEDKPPASDPADSREEPDSYEEDLGEKLLRKAVTGAEEDIMAQILRLMHESSRKLTLEFDPGARTQGMQAKIVERLDEAIKLAAAQQHQARGEGQSTGDKRRLPEDGETGETEQDEGEGREGDATAGSGSTGAGVVTENPERRGGPLSERRRAWGNLPPRDREEVIQGKGEGFLERYRQQIERYYRALQEADD